MATFVLIHGAGSTSWYWHLVTPKLEAAGHDVVVMDLPCDDDSAGLAEYTDVVVDAIHARSASNSGDASDAVGDSGAVGDAGGVVLVAQSMGGLTAPLVCTRVPVRLMVLVAAMVPASGETPGAWWVNVGQPEAQRRQAELEGRDPDDDDPVTIFLHDLPPDVIAESAAHIRNQSGTPFEEPWPLPAWPDVPTRFLLGRHDRLFPAPLLRRVVHERLGFIPDEIDSGHLPALGHPQELADRLLAYVAET